VHMRKTLLILFTPVCAPPRRAWLWPACLFRAERFPDGRSDQHGNHHAARRDSSASLAAFASFFVYLIRRARLAEMPEPADPLGFAASDPQEGTASMLNNLGMPIQASTHAASVDHMIILVHWLMAVLFIGGAWFFVFVAVPGSVRAPTRRPAT